jgi:hypothetical protein
MIRSTSPQFAKEVVGTMALVKIRLVPFKRWNAPREPLEVLKNLSPKTSQKPR